MPTYVYACDTCGAQFEQFQSFKEEPLRTCPSCAGAVRRVFQPVGIVFKGSGWYITDSRKSSSAAVSGDDAGKPEKAAAGDTVAKSEAKSEPAAKSESASETKSSSESKSTA
jgi:putative FmdB family regulatory protein